MQELFFDMAIVDKWGKVHARIRYPIDDRAAYMGPRTVVEMRLGLGDFNQTVEILRIKELRRKLLLTAAQQAGAQLADHLEDREGWHGLDRQERIEKTYRSP